MNVLTLKNQLTSVFMTTHLQSNNSLTTDFSPYGNKKREGVIHSPHRMSLTPLLKVS